MDNTELQHWGVKGMKWGVRRYQNKDGTLTAAGKKRYAQELEKLKKEEQVLKNRKRTQAQIDKLEAKRKKIAEEKKALDEAENPTKESKSTKEAKAVKPAAKKRKIKDLSNEELAAAIERLKLEKDYMDAVTNRIKAASAREYETLKTDQKSKDNVKQGKSFFDSLRDDVLLPGAKEAGKQIVKSTITDLSKKAMSGARKAMDDKKKKDN